MAIAIETRHLSKTFHQPQGWRRLLARLQRSRPVTAVDDVNLQVEKGELFGLLGPNGAGKTTLAKMLCTLIAPSGGSATVAGHPLAAAGAIRAAVGLVVADERSFYWRLSGRQNLAFFATMYGLRGKEAARQVEVVLGQVDMAAFADRRFSDYSTGMKQRIALARSMLHRPQILFLDEPSRSLDPSATRRLHSLLRRLVTEEEVTIFLITHDLLEAEKLCRRVAVMHRGRVRAVGDPAVLRGQLGRTLHYTLRVDRLRSEVEARLAEVAPDLTCRHHEGHSYLTFTAAEADGRLTAVLDSLRSQGLTIYTIEGTPPSLEEVFAFYTNEQAGVA